MLIRKSSEEVKINFSLIPQGAVEHTLYHAVGPMFRQGSWDFAPPCQSIIGYGFLGSRKMGPCSPHFIEEGFLETRTIGSYQPTLTAAGDGCEHGGKGDISKALIT